MSRARIPLALLVLVWALATPAQAGTVTHRDAGHDVVRYDYGSKHSQRDATNRGADIVSATVTHGRSVVTLSVHLRALSASYFVLVFQLQMAGHRTRDSVGLVQVKGAHEFSLQNSAGARRRCPGLRKQVLRGRSTIRFTVPRSCLGRPAWVRAGAAIEVEDYRRNRSYDDLSQRRGIGRVDPERIPLGPKVFHG